MNIRLAYNTRQHFESRCVEMGDIQQSNLQHLLSKCFLYRESNLDCIYTCEFSDILQRWLGSRSIKLIQEHPYPQVTATVPAEDTLFESPFSVGIVI